MKLPRSVVLDLLPLYLAGELRPETKNLLESEIADDLELSELVERLAHEDTLAQSGVGGAVPAPRPELALRSFERTRKLLGQQRRLFAFGIFFTLISLSFEFNISNGRLMEAHLLMRDSPWTFGSSLVIGIICWIWYFVLQQRLRTDTGPR
jgi:hypothetical protein